MHRGLVALSASAVAAIYTTGYVRTQTADATIEAPPAVVAAATFAPSPTAPPTATALPFIRPQPTAPGAARATATVAPAPQRPTSPPAVASQPQAAYKDGTFSGQGSSRRGNVWVSVTIQGGQIGAVTITRSTLQYPVRDIAGLPGQVVQRQGGQVDTVSGATYSSQAFRTAINQALAQAA
jgi:uncharacterized protein with FMN-binding domain